MKNVLVVDIASQEITNKINGLKTACSFTCSKHCIPYLSVVGQTGLVVSQKKLTRQTVCSILCHCYKTNVKTIYGSLKIPMFRDAEYLWYCRNHSWEFRNNMKMHLADGSWFYTIETHYVKWKLGNVRQISVGPKFVCDLVSLLISNLCSSRNSDYILFID